MAEVKAYFKKLRKKAEELVSGKAGRAKYEATQAAAEALISVLPVWSGSTQDSVRISEGSPQFSPKLRPARHDYMSDGGTTPTSMVPVGQGREDEARPWKIREQARRVSKSIFRDVYITANSSATDAGLWEGRAPTPQRARNPRNSKEIILEKAAKGTKFIKG